MDVFEGLQNEVDRWKARGSREEREKLAALAELDDARAEVERYVRLVNVNMGEVERLRARLARFVSWCRWWVDYDPELGCYDEETDRALELQAMLDEEAP